MDLINTGFERIAEGVVLRSDPAQGTELKRDAAVDLVVSLGPEPIEVPDFTERYANSLAVLGGRLAVFDRDGKVQALRLYDIVTGKDLPAKPYDFVYGNRLIRLGVEAEKAEFLKDPKRYIAELDKALEVANELGAKSPLAMRLDRAWFNPEGLLTAWRGDRLLALTEPAGGSVLWPRLPVADTGAYAALARRHGVHIAPGSIARPARGPDPHLRICVDRPWTLVEEGIRRLGLAWRELDTAPTAVLG